MARISLNSFFSHRQGREENTKIFKVFTAKFAKNTKENQVFYFHIRAVW